MNTFSQLVTLSDSEVHALAVLNDWEAQIIQTDPSGSQTAVPNPQTEKDFCKELFSKEIKALILPITVQAIQDQGEQQKISLQASIKAIDDDTQTKVADATKAVDIKVVTDVK